MGAGVDAAALTLPPPWYPRPMKRTALAALALLSAGCHGAPPAPPAVTVEAGFLEVPARDVTVKGQPVSIEATGRLFYNLRPADDSPEDKPILVLFNGFADDIVRAYGTGPTTVEDGGAVVSNPASFTRFANLVYVEPRQAGFSYDVITSRPPGPADCAPAIFNEYVDAADVLLAVLAFLDAHPQLTGPVYWVGESYAGVRVTWILTYLRGRWDLVPVRGSRPRAAHRRDAPAGLAPRPGRSCSSRGSPAAPTRRPSRPSAPIPSRSPPSPRASGPPAWGRTPAPASTTRTAASTTSLTPWRARQSACSRPTRRTSSPTAAAALIGVPLGSIPLLAAAERSRGFKCSPPDDTVPSEAALVSLLGALPAGQSYYIPYSPLLPGKETTSTTLDWQTQDFEALAFVDGLHDVPAFLTKGDHDLVVPTLALAPALRAVVGAARVDAASPSRLGVVYPDGERFIDIFDYPSAGHMISMLEPAELASDVEGWLAAPHD